MSYYAQELVEEIRSRSDIVDVISGYVKLQRKGSNYVGVCPFHNDRNPSMSVNQPRQMYHCFSCGAGGDVFKFVMDYENLTFPEAVKVLADRAGIELPEQDYSPEARKQADLKEQIMELNRLAGKYYYYMLLGAKTTYIYTIIIFVILLSALADSKSLLLLGLVMGGLLILYLDLTLQDKLTARRQEIVLDLPQVLSKLTLLVNSGMVLRDAWKKVSITGERALYQEMQNANLEMENGVMEIDAYRNFAERCNVKEVRKFTSLIIQNLNKGNEELAYFMKDLSDEMWEVKKNEVKQKGEKANSKLLLPMMMIFIGILLMVMVPVMQQM